MTELELLALPINGGFGQRVIERPGEPELVQNVVLPSRLMWVDPEDSRCGWYSDSSGRKWQVGKVSGALMRKEMSW
jgi:hypothetical protein